MRHQVPARRWAAPPLAAPACAALLLGGSAVAAPRAAGAQGFGLNEIGSCAVGRGFAVTSTPCDDASVLYWNPGAAATQARGLAVHVGASAIQVRGRFTADYTGRTDDADVPVELPPFVGVNWKGRGRVALGLAAYVPYGLTSRWRDDFPGRFTAQRASLRSVYVQPNVAVELVPGRLSVGGGPVVGSSRLELVQALDVSTQTAAPGVTFAQLGFAPGTEFARARIAGSGTGIGFNLGAQARLADWLQLGARYLSPVTFDYDGGEATFTPSPLAAGYVLREGNPLGAPPGTTLARLTEGQFAGAGALAPGQTASTTITHPAQLQVGLGFETDATTLAVEYAAVLWRSFDALPVTFDRRPNGNPSPPSRVLAEEYETSHGLRVGAEHRYRGGLAARAGFGYATSPAPDQTVTPLLPDMDRYNFSVGAAIPLGARLTLDAAYLRVETEGRRGRLGERPDGLSAAETVRQLNDGWFALDANVVSLSLKARF